MVEFFSFPFEIKKKCKNTSNFLCLLSFSVLTREQSIEFNAGAWKRMLKSKMEGIFSGHFKASVLGPINLLDKSQV